MNPINSVDNTFIQEGKICPYCYSETEFVKSSECYNRDFGMIYLCRSCSAWVGVHAGTNIAKGRLANAELRHWKIQAHSAFDKLWQKHLGSGIPRHVARNNAYDWMAKEMQKDRKQAHIGMFDIEECKQVILLANSYQSSGEQVAQPPKPTVAITLRDLKKEYENNVYISSRELNQETAKESILKWCSDKNVNAIEIQSYQIRFSTTDKKIDIFPQSRKYHDIIKNERGSYKHLINFLNTKFPD